jgi:hypothetical protein
VDVRLAVRDDNHLLPAKVALENFADALGGPRDLFLVAPTMLRLDVANELTEVPRDRLEIALVRATREPLERLAAQQVPQALHPSSPAQLGDEDGDERDDDPLRDEEVKQVGARLLASTGDETEIVYKDEASHAQTVRRHGPHRDVE